MFDVLEVRPDLDLIEMLYFVFVYCFRSIKCLDTWLKWQHRVVNII